MPLSLRLNDLSPELLYWHFSADGVARQRCGRHVARNGTYRPLVIWFRAAPSARHSCIACYYERIERAERKALLGGEEDVEEI